jgi:putative DNA primase/helicase
MTIEPFRLHTAAEWARLDPPRWLVPDFLAEQSLAVIFGASGSGKSFLAAYLAHVLASGLNWRAGAIDPASVIYLAAENPGSLAPRFAALQSRLGGDFPGLFLVADEINLLAEKFADRVSATICSAERESGLRVGLLIIDTMRDAWPGNEDSSTEVSRAFAPLKAIRDRHGLCVLLVHHSGHNGDRERGSSHIRANADTVWSIEERGQQRVIACLKMRDAARPNPFAFTLEPAGDSCVVAFSDDVSTPSKARPLSPHQRLALDSLASRIVEAGEPLPASVGVNARGVLCAEWRKAFYDRLGDTEPEAKRKAFQRSLTELQARNAVAVMEGYAWTC